MVIEAAEGIITSNINYFWWLDQIITYLPQLADHNEGAEVRILTYNLYPGTRKAPNRVGIWLDKLSGMSSNPDIKVYIKIGRPMVKGKLISKNKWYRKIRNFKKRWPNFTITTTNNCHAKMILVSPRHVLIGSKNLTDSPLLDITTYYTDEEVYKLMIRLFKNIRSNNQVD